MVSLGSSVPVLVAVWEGVKTVLGMGKMNFGFWSLQGFKVGVLLVGFGSLAGGGGGAVGREGGRHLGGGLGGSLWGGGVVWKK